MSEQWEEIRPGFVARMSAERAWHSLDHDGGAIVQQALAACGVLVLQDGGADDGSSPAQLEHLARALGTPAPVPPRFDRPAGSSCVQIVATDEQGTTLPDSRDWHVDGSFDPDPPRYTVLQARLLPATGGDTHYADMAGAYDQLPDAWRDELEGAVGTHHFTRIRHRPAHHPVITVCPATGRRALYLNATFLKEIRRPDGTPVSIDLDDLHAWATQDERVYRHHWRPGDTVVWDNTKVMHRATPVGPGTCRLMHRVTVLPAHRDGTGSLSAVQRPVESMPGN